MPMPRIDIAGQKFGRLVVVGFSHTDRESHWKCRCECGNETVVRGGRLRSGETVSCGCYGREQQIAAATKHGLSHTYIWHTWAGIRDRVTNPECKDWPNYGGRGIGADPPWLESVEAFAKDMGPRPSPAHSVERIDVNGDYTAANCKWATRKEQCRNKRNNYQVVYRGGLMPLAKACELAGGKVNWHKARNRIWIGWSVERAVEFAGDGRV